MRAGKRFPHRRMISGIFAAAGVGIAGSPVTIFRPPSFARRSSPPPDYRPRR
ncbi:MAG: hypothetical protein K6U03_07840 [Firmicutes bacterium]|nr:hypothetical protein [Bacillota bacterium]